MNETGFAPVAMSGALPVSETMLSAEPSPVTKASAGLLGYLAPALAPELITAALQSAPWRGPAASVIECPVGGVVALGSARAARVGHLGVAFHGRIDNLAKLARDLEVDGDNPCAVIAAAYLRNGDEFASQLLGDFAILVLDERRGLLLGTRDWVGARPLFWGEANGVVAFGSEAKQVLALLNRRLRADEESLAALEQWTNPAPDRTFVAGVAAVMSHGQVAAPTDEAPRAWQRSIRFEPVEVDLPEAVRLVRERLETAVSRRTAGAEHLGAQISGGMDSTSVTATAASLAVRRLGPPVGAGFTQHFPDVPKADETVYARAVAERWEIPLNEVIMRPAEMLTWAERGFLTHDGPTVPGFASQANLMAAAREAGIDVLLTGTGGDCWLRQNGTEIRLAVLRGDWRALADWSWLYARRSRRAGAHQIAGGVRGRLRGDRAEAFFEQNVGRFFNRAGLEGMELEGMRNGLRVESPLVDQELAMLLAGLPPRLRSMPSATKLVMRRTMEGLLPESVLDRMSWTILDPVAAAAVGELDPDQTATGELWRRYAASWRGLTLNGKSNAASIN